jgi:hypothetical protein
MHFFRNHRLRGCALPLGTVRWLNDSAGACAGKLNGTFNV